MMGVASQRQIPVKEMAGTMGALVRVGMTQAVHSQRISGRRGYVLIAFSLSLFFLLGMVGLAVDLGAMYTSKNEAQSFVDSAALDAALKLNDTQEGVTRALAVVAANPKRWQFGTQGFTTVTTTFGTSPFGTFVASTALPNPPTDYLYARVETHVSVPLRFLPVIVKSSVSSIGAMAVAGKTGQTSYTEGLIPFSPFSHYVDPTTLPPPGWSCPVGTPGDRFGFQVGERYTLRWPAGVLDPNKSQSLSRSCSGDRCPALISMANNMVEARGYIALNAASGIRESIVSDAGYFDPIGINTILQTYMDGVTPGTMNVQMDALGVRVAQDTDSISTEYGPTQALYTDGTYKYRINNGADPHGNGRRIIVVPVNNGVPGSYAVIGFARFFLDGTEHDYRTIQGSRSGCAEYIGPADLASTSAGGGNFAESTRVRLYQ